MRHIDTALVFQCVAVFPLPSGVQNVSLLYYIPRTGRGHLLKISVHREEDLLVHTVSEMCVCHHVIYCIWHSDHTTAKHSIEKQWCTCTCTVYSSALIFCQNTLHLLIASKSAFRKSSSKYCISSNTHLLRSAHTAEYGFLYAVHLEQNRDTISKYTYNLNST